ncbi:DNA polymerase I [Williamsoniiplasma somnilux]|uniref:DNA polymerase I n=1 Tax=Williamsoniiplasma somnilux TaxID=215578 RepID=A0A2K8NZD4_9MOLU|nr:DNA polymerase I [Williamsoniiplasma somnilux]ATZ18578.1 DNA polymerase I [Williamsoniiplasma somnilux]
MDRKKILLIDGNSLIFRAYFASAYTGTILKTTFGTPTNAIFSFANMITSLLNKGEYYDVKVAFDKGKHTFRHDKLENYKSGRLQTPEELVVQFPLVREMLDSAGIDWFEIENFEADDIIGAIDKFIENNIEDATVEILTSDKDMFQLISDKTKILIPISGTSDLKEFGLKELKEKWNIVPEQVVDLKGLMGDTSDNLKGVSGVGEKTAIKLINEFLTVEGIYQNIENIKGALKQKLINDKDSAFLCKEIAIIRTDFYIDNLQIRKLNITTSSFIDFLNKYEMYSLTNRMQNRAEKINDIKKHEYKILEKWDTSYECKKNYIFVESLEENYHNGTILGIGITNEKGSYFLKVQKKQEQQLNFFEDLTVNFFDQIFNTFLKNEKVKKYTYDVKKTVTLLKNFGYEINYDSFVYDMMIAGYVLDSNLKSSFTNYLKLASTELNIEEDEFIYGKGAKTNKEIDDEIKFEFISKKSSLIMQTYNDIIKKLKNNNQYDLYSSIDFPFWKVLFSMEQNGVMIDKTELNNQTYNTLQKLNEIENEMRNILGDIIPLSFNFSSPKQMQKLLFEDLKLSDVSKGSTGKDILEKIYDQHPVVPLMLKYRKLSKLYSTYLKGFEKYIFEDKCVHTIFNQTLTNTGRISSIEPNLQNISIHDLDQKEVRKIFVVRNSSTFYSFDYSQIELRVLAQMAPERQLLSIFANNGDVHEATARKIFSLDENQIVEPEMRRVAKVFNFGIIYGLSDFGLANDLNISIPEAKNIIQKYYESFPDILEFKKRIIKFANDNGYVATIANRKRIINELKSLNYQVRQFGERVAVNMPIQGTAADILKVAMIDIYSEIIKNNYKTKMIAQIHDEIIFEIPEIELNIVPKIIKDKMINAISKMFGLLNTNQIANVELKVSQAIGKNWFELK